MGIKLEEGAEKPAQAREPSGGSRSECEARGGAGTGTFLRSGRRPGSGPEATTRFGGTGDQGGERTERSSCLSPSRFGWFQVKKVMMKWLGEPTEVEEPELDYRLSQFGTPEWS